LTAHSCQVEWTPAKLPSYGSTSFSSSSSSDELSSSNNETLEYILHLQKSPNDKSSEYKEVYRGDACYHRLKDLTPNTEYNVRVCSIRVLSLKHSSSSNEEITNTQRICSPVSPHFSFTTLKVKTNPSNLSGKNLADESSSFAANTNNTSESTGSKMGGLFMWPSFFSKLNSEPSSSKKLNKLAEKAELKSSTNNTAKNQNHLLKRNSINRINTSNNDSSSSTTIKTNNNNNNNTKVNRKMSDKHWAILLILVLVLIAFLTAFTVNTVYTSLYEVTPLVPSTDNL
jgi:hypothetical protein